MADPMQQARELPRELLPCPFCGGEATLTMVGNVHSTRKCIVKCSGCRYQRTDAALRYGDEWLRNTAIAAWNRRVALRAAPEGFVMVPVEPSIGVLASMAIRRDHGLGCPGYYDAPVFGAENVGHQRRMEVAIGEARQQYAEVVGKGFYSLDREGHYAGLAARPQGVKDAG